MKEYLSKNEVAEKLGVSLSTVDRWIAKRQITYLKIGGTVRFKIVHLENFLEKNERKSKRIVA